MKPRICGRCEREFYTPEDVTRLREQAAQDLARIRELQDEAKRLVTKIKERA